MASTKPSVAIVYGFAEGTRHSKKLRRQLLELGYSMEADIRQADILIAHSGGCYMVPPDAQAKVVFHIGYTYWPGRPLLKSLLKTQATYLHSQGLAGWSRRALLHTLYVCNLWHTARMIPGWREPRRRLTSLTSTRHVFIRNREDSYCNVDALLGATESQYAYISMPGGHEDIWDNPAPYVNLIQSVHG